MKIQVEIKDDFLFYSYKIGFSDFHGKTEMSADVFTLFSKLLEMCSHVDTVNHRERKKIHDKKLIKMLEAAYKGEE